MRALVVSVAALLAAPVFADPPQPGPSAPGPGETPTDAGSGSSRDPLDAARALEASLDYERALAIVDREIAHGAAETAARLAELELLAGKLAAGLDEPDVAQAHFARALALAPATRLPDGTSPKLTLPFDAARAATVPLHVVLERVGDVVTARVGTDPAHVFAGIRLRLVARPGLADEVVARGTSIRVPAGSTPSSAAAVDEHGNELVEVPLAPSAPLARALVAPALAPAPVVARWSTWAIAAGGALAIAGTCAWRAGTAQDEWNRLEGAGGHDYTELAAVEARGRDWALAANVGFGVAAAAGVTAIVMLVLHHAPPPVRVDAGSETVGIAAHF